MTSAKLLFTLQEFDLELDSLNTQIVHAQDELNARLPVEQAESVLLDSKNELDEVQVNHKLQQLESESLKERSSQLDQQLYSGEITSPRDLASLELESGNVKAQIDQKELGLLELSVKADSLRSNVTDLEEKLAASQEDWSVRQAELTGHVESLSSRKDELINERDAFASTISQSEMGQYERLRQSKGGTAVAKVERGLCQACMLSLPTQHLQRVKSGKQTVLCSSCGRMLFLG